MKNTYFVTGTDTGVGKTLVTAAMLHAVAESGKKSLGLKPLAAGAEETEQGLRNEDALLLQQYASVKLPYSQVNPVLLSAPMAPHIAAMQERRIVQLDRLEGICRGALMTPADIKLIEGAGGWRVPLNPMELYSGLPLKLQTPVILVVGLRLGCLNHALLTAETIVSDGLKLAGWVANVIDPGMDAVDENIETLKALLPGPCLGVIPALKSPKPENLTKYLQLDALTSS